MTAYLKVSPRISAGTLARSNRTFLDGPVETYRCQRCGGRLEIDQDNLWRCTYCWKAYANEVTHGKPRPVYIANPPNYWVDASGKPMEAAMIDKRNGQKVVGLWCKLCDWKGRSTEAGWTEGTNGGEWTCPECGSAESIRVVEGSLVASDEDHEKALAYCQFELDNAVAKRRETLEGFTTAQLTGVLVERWIAEIEAVLAGPDCDTRPCADGRVCEVEVCECCGSGIKVLRRCPRCEALICQDCEDVHVCDPN